MKNKIAILMATYNGEKYIDDQILSILNQSRHDFSLIIRDDGSTDGTLKILKEYESKYSNIIVFENTTPNHGQLQNFAWLFNYVKSTQNFEYIMFSDQDDIWYKDKVRLSYEKMNLLNNEEPNLLYTNYDIYNSANKEKREAYSNELKYSFERLIVQSWLMGCTMMLNRKMIELIDYIPENIDNHDYWISIIAAINKNIHYLGVCTMMHRLHSNNVTARTNSASIISRIKKMLKIFLSTSYRKKRYSVWESVLTNIDEMYDYPQKVDELKKVLYGERLSSIKAIRTYGFKGMNFMSTASFYVLIFLKGRK